MKENFDKEHFIMFNNGGREAKLMLERIKEESTA